MDNIILILINNFDFTYMLIINVLTYMLIKIIQQYKQLCILHKRLLLLFSIAVVTCIYKYANYDNDIILINSAILAPVSWSWIFKHIVKKLTNNKK